MYNVPHTVTVGVAGNNTNVAQGLVPYVQKEREMYGGGVVLGATTTTAAAIVLPNTGSNRALAIAATITLAVGIVVTVTTLARLVAKKAYKG